MGPLIIATLLGLAGILIVVQPLLGLEKQPAEQDSPAAIAEVAERERRAKQALRELDLDYRLGNLDTPDFEQLHERYERRALAALRSRYQREQELDALIERQLEALRQQEARRPSAKKRHGGQAFTTATVDGTAHDPAQVASAHAGDGSAPATPQPGSRNAPRATSVRERRSRQRKGV